MFIYIEREKERKRERDRVLKLVVYSTWASGVSSSMTEPLDCDVAGRDRGADPCANMAHVRQY